jgi:hypothetical protein
MFVLDVMKENASGVIFCWKTVENGKFWIISCDIFLELDECVQQCLFEGSSSKIPLERFEEKFSLSL